MHAPIIGVHLITHSLTAANQVKDSQLWLGLSLAKEYWAGLSGPPRQYSKKKTDERPPDKDRKKDVPQPRMQFDDVQRVVKAKKRSVVNTTG